MLGALPGLYADASQKVIAVVMAVGAGVPVSSVAFELMDTAYGIVARLDPGHLGPLQEALAVLVQRAACKSW